MKNTDASRKEESEQMQRLANRMKCRVTHDECGDAVISGKSGNIHVDGAGYSVSVLLETGQQWTWAKKSLCEFSMLRQDGDTEGVVHMKRLPSPEHAETLRLMLRIPKLFEFTPEVLEKKRECARIALAARQTSKADALLAVATRNDDAEAVSIPQGLEAMKFNLFDRK